MRWVDYTIDSIPGGRGFKVEGDWEGEVMGIGHDGSYKDHYLYRPGDVFIVNESGWLVKTDQVNTLLKKFEEGKAQKETT